MKGKLIAFEGIDTSGKSTQARRLAKRLINAGHSVVSTGEPGGTPIGNSVRSILLSRQHASLLPFSELLLFIVSRAQNTHEVIVPALRAGKTVVASRYRMSSVAYQGYGRGIDLDLIRSLNETAACGLHPDVTFLIDIPAEVAIERKTTEGDRIEVESLEFHLRVRQGFLELAKGDPNAVVIDGDRAPEEIAEDVARYLQV
ncbi:dTMP kinase [Candidatus Bipolaricaulota bacterium]|nr:dTMP kinase [Candidatus Bipolaricaulota bacterium]